MPSDTRAGADRQILADPEHNGGAGQGEAMAARQAAPAPPPDGDAGKHPPVVGGRARRMIQKLDDWSRQATLDRPEKVKLFTYSLAVVVSIGRWLAGMQPKARRQVGYPAVVVIALVVIALVAIGLDLRSLGLWPWRSPPPRAVCLSTEIASVPELYGKVVGQLAGYTGECSGYITVTPPRADSDGAGGSDAILTTTSTDSPPSPSGTKAVLTFESAVHVAIPPPSVASYSDKASSHGTVSVDLVTEHPGRWLSADPTVSAAAVAFLHVAGQHDVGRATGMALDNRRRLRALAPWVGNGNGRLSDQELADAICNAPNSTGHVIRDHYVVLSTDASASLANCIAASPGARYDQAVLTDGRSRVAITTTGYLRGSVPRRQPGGNLSSAEVAQEFLHSMARPGDPDLIDPNTGRRAETTTVTSEFVSGLAAGLSAESAAISVAVVLDTSYSTGVLRKGTRELDAATTGLDDWVGTLCSAAPVGVAGLLVVQAHTVAGKAAPRVVLDRPACGPGSGKVGHLRSSGHTGLGQALGRAVLSQPDLLIVVTDGVNVDAEPACRLPGGTRLAVLLVAPPGATAPSANLPLQLRAARPVPVAPTSESVRKGLQGIFDESAEPSGEPS